MKNGDKFGVFSLKDKQFNKRFSAFLLDCRDRFRSMPRFSTSDKTDKNVKIPRRFKPSVSCMFVIFSLTMIYNLATATAASTILAVNCGLELESPNIGVKLDSFISTFVATMYDIPSNYSKAFLEWVRNRIRPYYSI